MDEEQAWNDGASLETVRILHKTVVSLRSALQKSKEELHLLREQFKNVVDPEPYNRTIESLSIENHVLRQKYLSKDMNKNEKDMGDKGSDSSIDDVFEEEKPDVNGVQEKKDDEKKDTNNTRISKGDSEESEEVDDIELIFTTDDTKELGGQVDLESISETDGWKQKNDEDIPENLKHTWSHSVLVETDISKCGMIDENEPPNQNRRNTLPTPLPYRPIIHKEAVTGNKKTHLTEPQSKPSVKFLPDKSPRTVRPILVEKNTLKQESEAQTDITAVPIHWRSESYLAHNKVSQNFTTLPSKFTLPFGQLKKHSLKLSEKTQEARRVLLSDINFTSMVPELSRSADHLCQETGSLLCRYPRAFSYMKNPDMISPGYAKGGWSPCDCHHRRPSWDYYHGSSTSIPPCEFSDTRRRHSMRPSLSSLDTYWMGPPQRPTWASMPSSPTHCQRSRSVPLSSSYIPKASQHSDSSMYSACKMYRHNSQRCVRPSHSQGRHKVKFLSDNKFSTSYPGMSLPDLRTDAESGGEDSTDSLIDESEDYLRRSIDSILAGDVPIYNRRRRTRSHSQPDHTYTNGCKPPKRAQPFLARAPSDLRIDQWVKVITSDGRLTVGKVRYVGPLPGALEPYVGVQLAPGEGGNCNGSFAGARYFDCDAGCGIFVPFKKVVMAWSI